MPELRTATTSSFEARWDDRNSGARRNGSFWHPRPDGDMRPLGSIAVPSHRAAEGHFLAQLVGPADGPPGGAPPPVASPTGYERIWKDEGSGADRDGSIWRPVAPAGYVALGDVASGAAGWDAAPSVDDVWCVRGDLVTRGGFRPASAWDDRGSGAASDVSAWEVVAGGRRSDYEDANSAPYAAGGDTRVFVGPMRATGGYEEPDASLALVVRK